MRPKRILLIILVFTPAVMFAMPPGAVPRPHTDQTALFFVLTLLLAFLVVLRVNFSREMADMGNALRNRNIAMQLYRNREFALSPPSLLLFLLYVINLGLYFYLALQKLNISLPVDDPFTGVLLLILIIMLIYWIRDASRRMTGLLFGMEDRINFFNYQISLLNTVCGMLLLPVLFILAFANPTVSMVALYVSAALLGSLYLYRMFQGFILSGPFVSASPFHFILYICTLEIAPLLIFYKVVINWISVA